LAYAVKRGACLLPGPRPRGGLGRGNCAAEVVTLRASRQGRRVKGLGLRALGESFP
jgi:hypothetical protein